MENKTIAQKLDALSNLQDLDRELDKLHKIKGDLPDEVEDLEDEIAGYETRLQKFEESIEEQDTGIGKLKQAKKDAEKLIEKYSDQQMNVRNNREYDAISKEIEMQQLDIQLFEKRTKEAYEKIELKKAEIEKIKASLDELRKDLEAKKKDLAEVIKESEGEEKEIEKKKEKIIKGFPEERLIKAYKRIRGNVKNGLAIVEVKRGACGGCFAMVPPQRQAEIKERKKIIVCEHCGRIFCGVEDVVVEEKPKKRRTRKKAEA